MEKSGLFTKVLKFWKCHILKIIEYLNTTKRYSGRILQSLKEMKVILKIHFVCILLGFPLNFLGDPYYERPTMVHDSISFTSVYFIMYTYDLPAACVIIDTWLLRALLLLSLVMACTVMA